MKISSSVGTVKNLTATNLTQAKIFPNLVGVMTFPWTAPDGEVFPCEEWLARGPVRGVVVCVHGMGGSAADFRVLAEALAAAGFAALALNLRGQGTDPRVGRRGGFLDLPVLAEDIDTFARTVRDRFPGVPVYFCGESLGALLVAWVLAEKPDPVPVEGVIFSAPVVELKKPTAPSVRLALRVLARVTPHLRFSPAWFVSGKTEPLRITRDEEHARWFRNSPHYIRAYTFRFLAALGDLMDSSRALARKITVPCLVLAGGQDVFLRPEQVRAWFDHLASGDKSFRLYPEAHHVLWNDLDRALVVADIVAWLRDRTPAADAPERASRS